MYSGNKRTLETHVRLFHMPYNIVRQGISNPLGAMVGGKDSIRIDKPMLTDRKELAVYYCKKCSYRDRLYNVVRRHIYREHFQHVTTPYVVKKSEKQENNDEAAISSYGIHCKSCLFVTRSYEALVQHVIEFHERIGYQVTAMIGHTNVIVAHSQASIIQRGAPVMPGTPHMVQPVNCFNMPKVMRVPVGNHFKQGVTGSPGHPLCITLPGKALLSSTPSQSYTGKHLGSFVVSSSHGIASVSSSMKSLSLSSVHAATATSFQTKKGLANALNNSQTQKWKICKICNELFPESAYTIHIEKEHQTERVQAMAKYIMKIHNFTSKCLYCNRYLPSDTLLNHMLIHGLTCPQCHSSFYEVEKMVAHKRQMHPNEPGNVPMDNSFTFDLTLQQGSAKNVQLIVTTYNMKEVPKSSSTTVHPPNIVGSKSTIITGKGPKRSSESMIRNSSQNVLPQNTEMSKTLCPICFTILKGPISDALAQHLQDRHQVIQTLHPVEKKLTYKCIHCLGVYTSNMTASTITLHLVHCRGVGQVTKGHSMKCISALKRELVFTDASNPKKKKMVTQTRSHPTIFVEKPAEPVLILDPRGHADESYDARKAFLTAYFNQQPYPSQREVEKLAASLWLWKSDVLSHFINQRRLCEQDFVTRKPIVLLGFNMQAVNQLKHEMNFDHEWVFMVNDEKKSGISRTVKKILKPFFDFSTDRSSSTHVKEALDPRHFTQSNCAFKPVPDFSEPIAIDFHRESEKECMDNRTLKTTPSFPSVVQTWTKETVLQERFLYKRGGRLANADFTKGGSKNLDGCVSGSRAEEATWPGGMSQNESLYRPAGRFEEKGKEMGLLGR